jgi:imidazolonepropionase-like amidohydrolase
VLPGPVPARGRLIVTADLLIDGTGAPPVASPAVFVVDGRVERVGVWGPEAAAPDGWEVVGGRGMTLLPGLVDAHAHLAFPEQDDPRPMADLADGARRHAAEALIGGVTTIRDLGSADGIALRLRDDIAAGRAGGPRILAAAAPITITGGHCDWFGERADTAEDLVAAIDRLADQGVDVIKVMATGGMASPRSDPYTPQWSENVLAPAVARAHARGLRVAAHALCTAGVRVAAHAGVDTIEHGWTITGRRQDFEESVVEEVRAAGAFGSVTTHDSLRELLPADGAAGDRAPGDVEEIRRRLVPHRALAAAGVPMVVHSDAGRGSTRFDDFAASIRCYGLGMEVAAVGAVRAATGTASAALGLAGTIGTVETGAVADLVLVDADVTAVLPTRDRIRRVILGGRTVALDGRLVS